jgi:hypothetical protein
MDIVDSTAKLRCDRIADGDACRQIARLECVLVILAAVAKMVAELDVANHRIAKLDQRVQEVVLRVGEKLSDVFVRRVLSRQNGVHDVPSDRKL